MELLSFQQQASDQIVARLIEYMESPVRLGRAGRERQIPFIQILSSITASGKTLMLADAVSSASKRMPVKPLVLWLSKASVVVAQTFAALNAGGAYHNILDDFEIRTLADYDGGDVQTTSGSLLFFATVGTFNQERKEEGTLNVFKSSIDNAETSTWNAIKVRPNPDAYRGPLIVVYDEAHNLSDGQTRLLMELEPDAFILSTATNRLPQILQTDVIDHLKKVGGFEDKDLHTLVDASRVAASGLIKREISLIGRQAPMEDVIAEMTRSLSGIASAAATQHLPSRPKAVYICKTNISQETGERDDPKLPFQQRKAPPILIWRHLTETLKVDPQLIAVYCDLKVDKNSPLPEELVLFKGGDKDYEAFVSGPFEHIIFNQSLQEGWDDPYVFCGYIDKSIGSKVQVEQIIGRLLRQPERQHFKSPQLNTAQLFVRVEAAGVFDEVVRSVEERITTGKLEIKLTTTKLGSKLHTEFPPKTKASVPIAAIITDRAEAKIENLLKNMTDYRADDGTNVRGAGKRVQVQRIVGGTNGTAFAWEEFGQSVTVLARWLFAREVAKIHKGALGVAVTSDPDGSLGKFDARVGLGSPAASHIADVAAKVGEVFVDQVYLKLRNANAFDVGSVLVAPGTELNFKNAVHDAYSRDDFNKFELAFAEAIDKLGFKWCRNSSRTG